MFELRFDGVTGYDPLFIPVEDVSDLRAGFVEVTAGKIGNDANKDITTNLITVPIIQSLSNGAWARDFLPGENRYYEGLPSAATGPLLWTLLPEIPIAPPAYDTDASGAYGFKEFAFFNGFVYACDIVNSQIRYDNAGVWTDTTAGLGGVPTETHPSDPSSQVMYVGVTNTAAAGAPYGRQKSTTSAVATWSNFLDPQHNDGTGSPAEHYTKFKGDLYYSYNRNIVKQYNGTNQLRIGNNNTSINRLAWFNNEIIVTKPEGVFTYDPVAQAAQQIFYAGNEDPLNGRVLVIYGKKAYFNMNFGFFVYDGGSIADNTFLRVEGTNTQIYNYGRVVGGYADGRKIWLVVKLITDEVAPTYKYYVVAFNGSGFHPVAVKGSTTDATSQIGGILLQSNKLYYSAGYASGANQTGYLSTDGDQPLANGLTFPDGAALVTGWVDFQRANLVKHWKQVIAEWSNLSTSYPAISIYYQKVNETVWTLIGTITASTNGGVSTLDIPAESGAQVGITSPKVRFKIVLSAATSIAGFASLPGTVANDASIGSTAWTNLNNAKTSDDTYANFHSTSIITSESQYLKLTNFGFAVPVGATITGVKVSIEGNAVQDFNSPWIESIRLVKAGVISGSDYGKFGLDPYPTQSTILGFEGHDATNVIGSSSDMWGLTLTPAQVNAANFGVVFNILEAGGFPETDDTYIDAVTITVYANGSPKPWFIRTLHVVGVPVYTPAAEFSIAAYVDVRGITSPKRDYNPLTIINGLRAAIVQAAPIKYTHIDGNTYYGRIKPVTGGDQTISIDPDEGTPVVRKFLFSFVEDK